MTKNASTADRVIRAGFAVTALGAGLSLGDDFTPRGLTLRGVRGDRTHSHVRALPLGDVNLSPSPAQVTPRP
jgi:hypothetical protein